jgi:RNA polymerase sigma-70 factor (ECF subfamily)
MGMDGARLLERLAGTADVEAVDWDAAYALELPRIYNYFRYRLGDRATAEDLTSLTFEKAWRSRHRYRPERAPLSTWLLAIARNVAIDHFRRPRPEVPLEDADADADRRAGDRGEPPPEEVLQRQGELRRLGALLDGLPARERELLALKYGAEATNRAIAKLTGLSESNVGTILHRTIGSLRAAWDEGGCT